MSDDLGRRRRLGGPKRSDGESKGWLLTIAAALVVVVAGWFLGTALARLANGNKTAQQTHVALATPAVSPSAGPAASAVPSPSSAPGKHAKTATPRATSPHPTASAQAVTSQPTRATPMPTATPRPPTPAPPARSPAVTSMRRTLPVARRFPTSAPSAVPAGTIAQDAAAEGIVRAYIDALRRGDPAGAATYLGNGAPDESFIDSATRVTDLTTTRNSDGSYQIAVKMQTAQGSYNETFVVAPTANGPRILGKTVTRI